MTMMTLIFVRLRAPCVSDVLFLSRPSHPAARARNLERVLLCILYVFVYVRTWVNGAL